jgi:hypothetical protein
MRGLIMNGFFEFLESKGIKDIKNLTVFVPETERDGIEKKLDEALVFFKNKKTNDNNTDLF